MIFRYINEAVCKFHNYIAENLVKKELDSFIKISGIFINEYV